MNRNAIIISISSDIGLAMAHRWQESGWRLLGTYRTLTPTVEALRTHGARLVHCDLKDIHSVHEACADLAGACAGWDALVLAPGSQDPIGKFAECDFDEWEESVRVNFTSQMRVVHSLLPSRRKQVVPEPCVLLFAGGGTNSATVNYSAYTISKIALIKMCELLDAEISGARFVIVGPGWVKTKIHAATLQAERRAGDNYQRTIQKLAGDECTPMDRVLDCLDWVINAPRELVGGRNFVVFDAWGTGALEEKLRQEPGMYKLRRCGNDWTPEEKAK